MSLRLNNWRAVLLACILVNCLATNAFAQQYWDTNGASGGLGGTGDWNLTTSNWNNSTGTGAAQNWANLTTSDAIFDGTAGTVTVTVPVQVNDMTFNVGGYTIAGSSALTLAGTTPIIDTAVAGSTTIISAQLSGTAGLNKRSAGVAGGTGKLILSNPANNYTGDTVVGISASFVHHGTLQLGASNVIPDSSNLVLHHSGTVGLNEFDTAGFSEKVGNLFVGQTTDITFSGATAASTLSVGSIISNSGGIINTGVGKLVLDGNVTHAPRDHNGGGASISGNVELNAYRVPWVIFKTHASTSTRAESSGTYENKGVTVSAVMKDGASSAGIIKTSEGFLDLSGASTYTGGTHVIEGWLNATTAATRLGANVVGNNVTVDGGAISFASAANIGSNQVLTLNSKPNRLAVLGLGYNGAAPSFTTSTDGVLALGIGTYSNALNMGTFGNGMWSLGSNLFSTSPASYTAGSLAPNIDDVYRLGGTAQPGSNATPTIILTNGVLVDNGATVRSVVVGQRKINGQGLVTLQGANTYSGTTTVQSMSSAISPSQLALSGANGSALNSPEFILNLATLKLDNSATNNNNRLGDSAKITSNLGEFGMLGRTGVATSETIGEFRLNSGHSTLTLSPSDTALSTLTLTASSLTRAPGATGLFRTQNQVAAGVTVAQLGDPAGQNVGRILFSSAPTLAGGSLGTSSAGLLPYVVTAEGAGNNVTSVNNLVGSSFATYDTNGIRPLNFATETTNSLATSGVNLRFTANTPVASSFSANSLHLDGASVNITGGAGTQSLEVSSGGVLSTGSGTNVLAASLEEITFGNNAATGYEGIVHASSNIQIDSVIKDNGANKVSLTKSGVGNLRLNGLNTYTGKTVVNNAHTVTRISEGSLTFTTIKDVGGGASSLGNPQTVADGTIDLRGSLQFAGSTSQATNRNINLIGPATLDHNTGGGSPPTLTFNGDITGIDQNLNLTTASSSGGGIRGIINGRINLGTGSLTMSGVGTWELGNTANTFAQTNIFIGQLRITADNALPTNSTLAIYGTATTPSSFPPRFDLNGKNQEVANLSDNGIGPNHQFFNDFFFGAVTNNLTGTTSTFTVNNSGINTFSGAITQNFANVGGNTAQTHFTKKGNGQLILYGSNTYSGNTTVAGGVLTVETTLANNGSNKVFIAGDLDGIFSNGAPTLSRATKIGAGYTGFGSTMLNGTSAADILAGSNTSGNDTFLTMQWRSRSTDTNITPPDESLASDIVRLTDMNNATGSAQTDLFALQMNYNAPPDESLAIAGGHLYLGWLDSGAWVNATLGNFGNNATLAQQGFLGSFSVFQTTYGTSLASYIGAWGLDTAADKAWAVLNHNSEFAVLAPEPAGAAMMLVLLAVGGMMRRRNYRAGVM